MIPIINPYLHSRAIIRQRNWRIRSSINEWYVENKHNTNQTEFEWWTERNDTLQLHSSITHSFDPVQSTGNEIGEKGAASLSDALKSNTTLAVLNLSCEDKINNTQMVSINNKLFPSFSLNQQTTTLETQEQHHWVMHWNPTQHSRSSIWVVKKKKRNKTQMTSINNQRFLIS